MDEMSFSSGLAWCFSAPKHTPLYKRCSVSVTLILMGFSLLVAYFSVSFCCIFYCTFLPILVECLSLTLLNGIWDCCEYYGFRKSTLSVYPEMMIH